MGPYNTYNYFVKNINYTVSFRDMASINYWNLIRIVRIILEKIAILFLLGPFEGLPILQLESSYSPCSDLWWINYQIIINKIRLIILMITNATKYITSYIHTCITYVHTHIHAYTLTYLLAYIHKESVRRHLRKYFSYSGVLKTCKSWIFRDWISSLSQHFLTLHI